MSISLFLTDIKKHLPSDCVVSDPMRLFALGTDASFYRLVPKVVVYARNETDVKQILKLGHKHQVSVTFRAAGTSLSGQAVTDSVLVMLSDAWRSHRVEPLGDVIHLQPGVIGAQANRALKPYDRKIGPDPASINACKIGGIVANNASGMCCGTAHNSYHTLHGIRIILFDGTLVDTREPSSVEAFRQSHSALLEQLIKIRTQLLAQPKLVEKVRHKYRLKNTTGYGLNAVLDFEDPVQMLAHLMVGSEGTLGFISEVAFKTVPDYPFRASAMIGFNDLSLCAQTVERLKELNVDAVELLDKRAVNSVKHMQGLPAFSLQLPDAGGMLLIDVRGESTQHLDENIQSVNALLESIPSVQSTGFTQSTHEIEQYWKIRKGTFPAVGAVREVGTTVIIEDVAFPLNYLAEGVGRLQALFDKYNYHEAIIFGHALEGNLHFVFTQSFENEQEIERYDHFMKEVSNMVAIEFGGSLKAEHGTGRNMAPFVALEWGNEAYDLMKQIKAILDPHQLLNPGVVINENDQVHIENLKAMPAADAIVDRCIECGFCEPICPSKDFTLTPRQRITTFRELTRLQLAGEPVNAQWRKSFEFQAIDSCAATGLCASQCPVDINTGELVLKLRAQQNHRSRALAKSLSRHFATVASFTRGALKIQSILQRLLGAQRLEIATMAVRRWTGGRTPLWLATTPKAAKPIYARNVSAEPTDLNTVVYWSSCVAQSMAGSVNDDRSDIPSAAQSVLKKAGLNIVYPQPTRGLCCGQPFFSKGHAQQGTQMMEEVLDALWEVSSGGRYPVLSDTSPCSLQLKESALKRGIQLYDSSAFIDRFLLNRLTISPERQPVAVHLTCSAQKQGLEQSFKRVLDAVTPNWVQPTDIACCGFAGDKGFQLPELNAAALKTLGVQTTSCAFGISTSRTCEIGLSKHSGLTYYSLFEVLDKVSTKSD
ncbi:FAD-binding oxidoreductase [Reinekea forsetii]|nr:FAD-binding oxidoreductase [Reinekea forsetii]